MSRLLRKKFSDLCKFTPKQLEATKAADTHRFTLYGGSRGPGKSYWLRWYLLRQLLNFAKQKLVGVRVGLFCEDYTSLGDRQVSKIQTEFPLWLGEVKESKTSGFGFHLREEYGSGVLALRNLDDPSKYQSAEFAAIGIDELTKNPLETFNILRGSLRWAGVDMPRFVAATNPGSKGHVWVKSYWIDAKFPTEMRPLANEFTFVRALPDDNPFLSKAYWQDLDALPDTLRRAWRHGDWGAFEGQFFVDFDADREVIAPFDIPEEWDLVAAIDPGWAGPCTCVLGAIDLEGTLYIVGTYYESKRNPEMNRDGIAEFFSDNMFTRGRWPGQIVSGHDAWAKKNRYDVLATEKTFADVFAEGDQPIYLDRATLNRHNGWGSLKTLMPNRLKIFRGFSTPLVDQLTSVATDKDDVDDIEGRGNDTTVEDHAIEALRYLNMATYRPAAPVPANEEEREYNEYLKSLEEEVPVVTRDWRDTNVI
jgi:phage terminase large subunit